MVRRAWMTAALLSASTGAAALQTIDVADGHTVTAKLSARELTRVAMVGERRIVRVWGLEERMTVEPDADGGQVFIRLVEGAAARPFSFFVKDDAGATYTVVAVPVDMPADAIVLRPAHPHDAEPGAAHPFPAQLKSLARAMALGRELPGYTTAPAHREVTLRDGAQLVLERRYSGALAGEIHRLTNTSDAPLRIDPRALGALAEDIEAVGVEPTSLEPGASTRVYLLRGAR